MYPAWMGLWEIHNVFCPMPRQIYEKISTVLLTRFDFSLHIEIYTNISNNAFHKLPNIYNKKENVLTKFSFGLKYNYNAFIKI